MISKKQYVEYLLSTPFNYTCTNLADHLDGVSHDVVTDSRSVRQEHLWPPQLWELVRGRIEDSPDAFLIADDSVQAKRYSRFMDLVKWQYSGVEHRRAHALAEKAIADGRAGALQHSVAVFHANAAIRDRLAGLDDARGRDFGVRREQIA